MKRTVVMLLLAAVLVLSLGATAGTVSPPSLDPATVVGGMRIDCGTLAGATAAAAFLGGWGLVTALPAVIGGIALVVYC